MPSYRIEVAVAPGINFAVAAESVDELLDEYEQIKGSRDWLVEQIMNAVPATERGEGVGALQAVLGEVVNDPATMSADGDPEGYGDPDGSESVVERVDPWSGQTVREPARKRSPARTEPSGGTGGSPHPASQPQRNTGNTSVEPKYDRFGNKYLVGLPEAPEDPNGHGKMVLKTWRNQAGREFTAYKCPNSAPDADYRNKCDAHEWPN